MLHTLLNIFIKCVTLTIKYNENEIKINFIYERKLFLVYKVVYITVVYITVDQMFGTTNESFGDILLIHLNSKSDNYNFTNNLMKNK